MSIRFHDWANKSMYIHGYVLCAFLCNNYAVIYCGNIYKILSLGMVFKAVCSSKKTMARPIHMLMNHGKFMEICFFL